MPGTVYASFIDVADAERAIGALLDHGVKTTEVSLVANEGRASSFAPSGPGPERIDYRDHDPDREFNADQGKTGITTTTGADAGAGAVVGAEAGLGIGVIAALASMFIPGIGLVIGGGALATAIAGAVATTAGGAIAGGVVGFLKDQGVPEETVAFYGETISKGGALLSVQYGNEVSLGEIEQILAKYDALNLKRYSAISVL